MIEIKHSIHVQPQLIHGQDGDYYNYLLRFSLCGKRKNFSLGVTSPLYDWDPKGRCFAPGACHGDAARRIAVYSSMLSDVVTRFSVVDQRVPTMDEVTKAFETMRGIEKRSHSHDIQRDLLDFQRERGMERGWKDATYKKFKTLSNHFREFRPGLTLDDVTVDVLRDFFIWLERERGQRNTTLVKSLRLVRWFLNWASETGRYKLNAQKEFHPKWQGTDDDERDIIYLTKDELKSIIDFVPGEKQKRLEHIQDMFLFSCFTSLRFSDIVSLRWVQVTDKGIVVRMTKTDGRVVIELNEHSRRLLDKYRGQQVEGGRVFPPLSNQRANEYLHELCRVVGINQPTLYSYWKGSRLIEEVLPKSELVTFHAARRSFISHAFRLGMPVPVIMTFSGHKSARMLKPYMAIMDDMKAQEMSKFDSMF